MTAEVNWELPDGKPAIIEERTITVYRQSKPELLLDFVSTLRSQVGEIQLDGDPEHAGAQFRAHPDVNKAQAETKYVFPPGGKEGMFAKAVLIPMEGGHQMLGFTSGESLPGQPEMLAIFIPNAPNPITGRLCFTHRDRVSFLNITTEEALKLVISSGNYLPPNLTQNTSTARNVVGSNTQ